MKTMTVSQALRITAENLSAIAVPRALNQSIGIPIDQAISNIVACIEALEKQEKEQQEKAEKGQETEEENGDGNAE